MTRLSASHRMQIIAIYNDLSDAKVVRNKCREVSSIAKQRGIIISKEGVRIILKKWQISKQGFLGVSLYIEETLMFF